jgi:hypothetical protein
MKYCLICLLFLPCSLFSQKKEVYQDLYIWDFTDNKDKKINDPLLIADLEAAFSACKDCRITTSKTYSDVAVAIKNDRLIQKGDVLSDALIKKLADKGIKNVLFSQVTSEGNEQMRIAFKIFSLQSKTVIYNSTLFLSQKVFNNTTGTRRDEFKKFLQSNLLEKSSSKKPLVYGIVAGIGTGICTYGLIQTLGVKNDWHTYLQANSSDSEKRYPTENSSYKSKQYISIAGGLIAATGVYLLLKNKKKKQQASLSDSDTTPKNKKIQLMPIMPTQTGGIGLVWTF